MAQVTEENLSIRKSRRVNQKNHDIELECVSLHTKKNERRVRFCSADLQSVKLGQFLGIVVHQQNSVSD